jgi:hypothetical protein
MIFGGEPEVLKPFALILPLTSRAAVFPEHRLGQSGDLVAGPANAPASRHSSGLYRCR